MLSAGVGVALVGVALAGVVAVLGIRCLAGPSSRLLPATAVVTAGVCAGLGVWLLAMAGPAGTLRVRWITDLGIGAGVHVDGLARLFVIVIVILALLTIVYSIGFLPHERRVRQPSGSDAVYWGGLLLFLAAVLGLVLAEDLVQLYVFWELTDIASFVLVGLNWRNARAREAAVRTLIVTSLGGFAVLAGLLIVAQAAGTTSIPALLATGVPATTGVEIAALLVIIGALTKAAQFPFHGWLPRAMIAPTPVNAFLDAAALLGAGVYLLARFHPLMAGTAVWAPALLAVGLASMVAGGLLAVRAREVKHILAYSTVSQYGFMVALFAGGGLAVSAALYVFVQHAVIKSALFFAAGLADHATGGAGGARLWQRRPATAVAGAIGALSLAGAGPLGGFWAKEVFFAAALETLGWSVALLGAAAGGLTLVYAFRFFARTLVHGTSAVTLVPSPSVMLAPTVGLAATTVGMGLAPSVVAAALVDPAVAALHGDAPPLPLELHPGGPLLLSLGAVALGIVAVVTRTRWTPAVDAVLTMSWSPERAHAEIAAHALAAGRLALRAQHGLLRGYIATLLAGALVLSLGAGLTALSTAPAGLGARDAPPVSVVAPAAMGLLLLGLAAVTVLTVTLPQHLPIVLALGASGYLLAGIFAMARAPGLGLVQAHVETLVTVLLLLGLAAVPAPLREQLVRGARDRLRAGPLVLAGTAGVASALLTWLALEHPRPAAVAEWLHREATARTGTSDPVATILLHVRALDTLGEVLVFAAATIGAVVVATLVGRDDP